MKKSYLITLLVVSIVFGCEKSDRDKDTYTNTSEDVAFATNLVYDVFKTIHQAAYHSPGIVSNTSTYSNTVYQCDSITIDTIPTQKSLRIDFNTNCIYNGITRNGYFLANFNGYYDNYGTTTTISFGNYSYNSNYTIISGTMSYQYNGLTDSLPTYTISFNQIKIQNKYSQRIIYSGNHQLKITQGKTTSEISDDNYSVNGINSGMAFNGNNFNSQITTNLSFKGNCNWIESGIIKVSPDNKPTRTINFGSECDKKIVVSIYETNYELELP